MMSTATEQKEVTANTVETFTRMSDVAFSGMERLAALNLSTARDSLQQVFAASMSMRRAENGKDQDWEDQDDDQDEEQNRGAGGERLTAYIRGVQEIVRDSQSEFAELMGRELLSFSKNGGMAFPGMQMLEKFAQQTGEMTNATVRNVTEMAKASVRNVAEATDDAAEASDDVAEATDDVADDVAEKTKRVAERTSQGRKPQK